MSDDAETHPVRAGQELGETLPARESGDEVAFGGTLGRYLVLERARRAAAWASCTRAYDPELDRKVALKLLRDRRRRRQRGPRAHACARRRRWRGSRIRTSSRSTTSATDGEGSLHRDGARRRARRCARGARRAGRGARSLDAYLAAARGLAAAHARRRSSIATSSRTTCSSATTAACASPTSGSRGVAVERPMACPSPASSSTQPDARRAP